MLFIMRIQIYSDGASRGNPGPSAIAFVITTYDGKTLITHQECVGTKTNNQAEYEALISALRAASELNAQEISVNMDSELLVKHMSGEYKVRKPELKRLWSEAAELMKGFPKVTVRHLPRTDRNMRVVDKLANKALDEHN